MNELREQISTALGDAGCMDSAEDKQTAVEAVMAVVEPVEEAWLSARAASTVHYEALQSRMAERDAARKDRDYWKQRAETLARQNEAKDSVSATVCLVNDELREQVASLQTRVTDLEWMNANLNKIIWQKSNALAAWGDTGAYADTEPTPQSADQPAECPACRQRGRHGLGCKNDTWHDQTFTKADQPAEGGEGACPACNDTGYRRERHAVRLQPCPHCDSANDKPEPPVDGGEGALNEWERDYYRKVQDEWAQKAYESDAVCPVCDGKTHHLDDCPLANDSLPFE